MRLLETHRVPLITAVWMIGIPLILAFVAGAGAGTALDGLAQLAGTLRAGFGGASLILGVLLLGWVLISVKREQSQDVHG